jgi:hypothetical protein
MEFDNAVRSVMCKVQDERGGQNVKVKQFLCQSAVPEK